jgi:hypothetical protein
MEKTEIPVPSCFKRLVNDERARETYAVFARSGGVA